MRACDAVALFGLVVSATSPAIADAGGFALSEQSTLAAGTGGAGVAREGDVAAAWYNPALLAGSGGWATGMGVMALAPQIRAQSIDGSWQEKSVSAVKTPPHLYLSYGLGSAAVGIAGNVPFGSGVEWPEAWQGQFESLRSAISVYRISPFGAYRFGRARIAAGPYYDIATLETARALNFADTSGSVDLAFQGKGFGFHAATSVQATDALMLGASYKSRHSVSMDGWADFATPGAFDARAHNQGVTTKLNLPDLVTVGGSYAVLPTVRVLADVAIATWSVYDAMVINFEDEETADITQVSQWSNRAAVRGGAEYEATEKLCVRGGAFFDPTPSPDTTLAANSPDSNRLGVTAGATYRLRSGLAVTAALEHVRLLARETQNENAVQAGYEGSINGLGVGIQYQR